MTRVALIGAHDEVEPAFSLLMGKLASACPAARVNEVQIQVYARALQRAGLGVEEVRVLFGRAITEFKPTAARPFPAVADLLEMLGPSADDAALLAWAALNRAAEAVGAYASVEMTDGAAAVALERCCGSWAAFCELEEGPQLALKRQEFLAAYRQARRGGGRPGTRRLAGLCEAQGSHPVEELAAHVWVAQIDATGAVVVRREEPERLAPVAEAGDHGRRVDASA